MATPATKLAAGAFVALLTLALAGADKVGDDRLVTPPPPPRSPSSPPARPAAPPRPLLASPPASHGRKKTAKILAGVFAAVVVASAVSYSLWRQCRGAPAVAAAPLGARAAAGGPSKLSDQDPDLKGARDQDQDQDQKHALVTQDGIPYPYTDEAIERSWSSYRRLTVEKSS